MVSSGITRINKSIPNYFILGVLAFIINKALEIKGIYIPFIHAYLDDLIMMPTSLFIIQSLCKRIYGKDFRLNYWHILLLTAYVSVMFEWIIPTFKPYFIADIIDVFCYFLGSFMFVLLDRR